MSFKNRSGRSKAAIALALALGLAIVALGGIALANVTTGGGAGFDVLSAGSSPQPPAPPKPPTPAPAPVPTPDTVPPAITGAQGTKSTSVKKHAKFNFGASEASTFICKVDNRKFQPCTSPFTAPKLGAGHHDFYVQAYDAAGNPSPVTKLGFQVKKPASQKKHR
jgi:hypothetical protein